MVSTLLVSAFVMLSAAQPQAAAPATPPAEAVPATPIKPMPAPEKPAKAPDLSLGSKAPIPDISNFIRGEKPTFFEPGRVYVIEFWATWCPPCKASMPHLSDLADKYKDQKVLVIGISDEKLETVEAFLNKDEWKQKARYTLATDPDRSTHKAYMEAAGQNGIPTAFIVKDGMVQWIGHPMEMEKPLEKIVAGTWNMDAAKKDFDAAAEAERKSMAKQIAIGRAYEAKDWPTVLKLMDELIADATGPDQNMLRLNKAQILLSADRAPEAYTLIDEVLKTDVQGQLRTMAASIILRTPDIKDRRVDTAIAQLNSALVVQGTIAPEVLAELGYAWSLKKDYGKAVEFTQRAIEAARSSGPIAQPYVDELTENLHEYQSKAQPAQAPAK